MTEIQKTIFVTAEIWHEVRDVVFDNIIKMNELFEEHLNISNYGGEVYTFTFVFGIVQPEDYEYYETYIFYSAEEKDITLFYRPPYEKIHNATLEENLPKMAAYFLEALEQFYNKNPKDIIESSDEWQDFDFEQFKADVEDLFEAQGWVVAEMV